MKHRPLSILLFGILALTVIGCAGNKKLQNEVEGLRMQVNTLSSDISQLDAQQRDLEQLVKGQDTTFVSGEESLGGRSAIKGESANIYQTPSGFTISSTSLQTALKNAGYYNGAIDGKIGSGTKDAIRRFQADNGLKTDGVSGRNTWAKLKVYAR